jgi:hypothetical protein
VNDPPAQSRVPSVASARIVLFAPGSHPVTGAPVEALSIAIRLRGHEVPLGDRTAVNVPPMMILSPARTMA